MSKIIEITGNGWVQNLSGKVQRFREHAAAKGPGYQRGLGSYALFGIHHAKGKTDCIADAPTSADFAPHITAANKKRLLASYDHLVEYREPSRGKPAVFRFWGTSE